MRKSWPLLAGIAVIGALAGAAIAGRSSSVDTFVIAPAVETIVATSAGDSAPPPATVGATPAPVVTTTVASTTSVPATTTTSTTPPATTAPATTAAPAPAIETLPKDQVRLVIANGDGRYQLVTVNADRLRAAGYTQIIGGETERVPATVLYFRPGFDDEASIVAADLLVPNAVLAPYPDVPITANDPLGDIVIVLGPDSIR